MYVWGNEANGLQDRLQVYINKGQSTIMGFG